MVKGTSRQVIVLHAPDPKLFEQAIFILKDDALKNGVSEESLLQEARQLLNSSKKRKSGKRKTTLSGAVWACGGALVTGMVWLITVLA